ncbi:MAG: nitrate/nitrite transporter NrtS [Acidimicrobiales bacterium]
MRASQNSPGGRRVEATWESYGDAARLFVRGVTVPPAVKIALVVGTWLSFLNQGQLIVRGHAPWLKLLLNFLTPFLVASLGYLAARRRRNVERLVKLLDDNR